MDCARISRRGKWLRSKSRAVGAALRATSVAIISVHASFPFVSIRRDRKWPHSEGYRTYNQKISLKCRFGARGSCYCVVALLYEVCEICILYILVIITLLADRTHPSNSLNSLNGAKKLFPEMLVSSLSVTSDLHYIFFIDVGFLRRQSGYYMYCAKYSSLVLSNSYDPNFLISWP